MNAKTANFKEKVLLSAPVIRSEIAGGAAVIQAGFDRVAAVQLTALIDSPLPLPVKMLETKRFRLSGAPIHP